MLGKGGSKTATGKGSSTQTSNGKQPNALAVWGDLKKVQDNLIKDLGEMEKTITTVETSVEENNTKTVGSLHKLKELNEMVRAIVEKLLVAEGKDGMILSVDQVKTQGNMTSVDELVAGQHGYNRSCINLYG